MFYWNKLDLNILWVLLSVELCTMNYLMFQANSICSNMLINTASKYLTGRAVSLEIVFTIIISVEDANFISNVIVVVSCFTVLLFYFYFFVYKFFVLLNKHVRTTIRRIWIFEWPISSHNRHSIAEALVIPRGIWRW